jgi:hypothetical protein
VLAAALPWPHIYDEEPSDGFLAYKITWISLVPCVPGYAKKVRAVPAWLKKQAYAEYGITQYKTGDYEVDHLIPLSLGGPNSIRNLRPQLRGCALRHGGLLLRYCACTGFGSSRFAGTLQESRPWHLGAASRSRPPGGVP